MLDLQRLYDWRSRYTYFMNAQRLVPFEWGVNDCAIGFVFGAVEALTGHDMAAEFRGQYDSEEGAYEVLRAKGAETLGDALGQYLPEQHPSEARVGDVGVVADDSPLKESFCLFDVTGVIVRGPLGHAMLPRDRATRSFKVG